MNLEQAQALVEVRDMVSNQVTDNMWNINIFSPISEFQEDRIIPGRGRG